MIALAIEKFVMAQRHGSPVASYSLAVAAAIQGDREAAKEHLTAAKTNGVLPNKVYMQTSPGLSSLQDEQWFQEFLENLPEP
jgi:hypothetical protein